MPCAINPRNVQFGAPKGRCLWLQRIDRKKPPPPGGFSIYYVPWSRAVCKRFHDEMWPSHLVVKSLTHGSWSGNIVNRKSPRGGGVLSTRVYCCELQCIAMCCSVLPPRGTLSWGRRRVLSAEFGNRERALECRVLSTHKSTQES